LLACQGLLQGRERFEGAAVVEDAKQAGLFLAQAGAFGAAAFEAVGEFGDLSVEEAPAVADDGVMEGLHFLEAAAYLVAPLSGLKVVLMHEWSPARDRPDKDGNGDGAWAGSVAARCRSAR
jgi:hypothetical protein